jgi:colicin import membrane protein
MLAPLCSPSRPPPSRKPKRASGRDHHRQPILRISRATRQAKEVSRPQAPRRPCRRRAAATRPSRPQGYAHTPAPSVEVKVDDKESRVAALPPRRLPPADRGCEARGSARAEKAAAEALAKEKAAEAKAQVEREERAKAEAEAIEQAKAEAEPRPVRRPAALPKRRPRRTPRPRLPQRRKPRPRPKRSGCGGQAKAEADAKAKPSQKPKRGRAEAKRVAEAKAEAEAKAKKQAELADKFIRATSASSCRRRSGRNRRRYRRRGQPHRIARHCNRLSRSSLRACGIRSAASSRTQMERCYVVPVAAASPR